ncbi:hypothetical protein D9758_009161 [Tetrapyrgos nigripes]|uniref:MYND-type domain-containing protein n=1 Tax=Tetrapyrgos nigripes TaxID=182062 RepID=A0A8H5G8R3_9AGAR|nr:hypothetical protein D9758_009161 [Tetrapyrgos nigripes]
MSGTVAAAYRHFRLPVPSSINPSFPSHDQERALLYLGVLSRHIRTVTQHASQRRNAIMEYQDHWKSIWAWTDALLKHYVFMGEPPAKEGIEFRDRLLGHLNGIITFQSLTGPSGKWDDDQSPSLSFMQSSPTLFSTIIAVWRHAVDANHSSIILLFNLFGVCLESSKADRSLFIRNCKLIVMQPGIVKRLLSYIYMELPCNQEGTLHSLQSAFRIVGFLAKETPAPFPRFFNTRETLACFSWSLKRVASPRRFATLTPHAASHSVEFSKFIVLALLGAFDTHGPAAVALMLRGGILHSMTYASRLIAYDEEDRATPEIKFELTLAQYFANFLVLLPAYLYYRRILDPVLQSLKKQMPGSQSIQKCTSSGSSPGNQRLQSLRGLLQGIEKGAFRKKAIREEFENQGLVICANPECPHQGARLGHKFRRRQCARCQATTYCSEKCQKRDWKAYNHREKCDSVRGGKVHDIVHAQTSSNASENGHLPPPAAERNYQDAYRVHALHREPGGYKDFHYDRRALCHARSGGKEGGAQGL